MAIRDDLYDVMHEIEGRIIKAEKRYGEMQSTHEALGVALEEWDELRAAIKANKLGSIEWECLDLAAVLIRLARTCRNVVNNPDRPFALRSGK